MRRLLFGLFLLFLSGMANTEEVILRSANDGQLLMENIPPIPETLPQTLSRYQNIRSARFSEWSRDSKSIFIKTRFGAVDQLHRVDKPGSARYQLTFGEEPIGEVSGQPKGHLLAITRDKGGDEFDQVYLLNPENGLIHRLSDGSALNNRVIWD